MATKQTKKKKEQLNFEDIHGSFTRNLESLEVFIGNVAPIVEKHDRVLVKKVEKLVKQIAKILGIRKVKGDKRKQVRVTEEITDESSEEVAQEEVAEQAEETTPEFEPEVVSETVSEPEPSLQPEAVAEAPVAEAPVAETPIPETSTPAETVPAETTE